MNTSHVYTRFWHPLYTQPRSNGGLYLSLFGSQTVWMTLNCLFDSRDNLLNFSFLKAHLRWDITINSRGWMTDPFKTDESAMEETLHPALWSVRDSTCSAFARMSLYAAPWPAVSPYESVYQNSVSASRFRVSTFPRSFYSLFINNIHVIYCPSFSLNSQDLSNMVGYQQPFLQSLLSTESRCSKG